MHHKPHPPRDMASRDVPSRTFSLKMIRDLAPPHFDCAFAIAHAVCRRDHVDTLEPHAVGPALAVKTIAGAGPTTLLDASALAWCALLRHEPRCFRRSMLLKSTPQGDAMDNVAAYLNSTVLNTLRAKARADVEWRQRRALQNALDALDPLVRAIRLLHAGGFSDADLILRPLRVTVDPADASYDDPFVLAGELYLPNAAWHRLIPGDQYTGHPGIESHDPDAMSQVHLRIIPPAMPVGPSHPLHDFNRIGGIAVRPDTSPFNPSMVETRFSFDDDSVSALAANIVANLANRLDPNIGPEASVANGQTFPAWTFRRRIAEFLADPDEFKDGAI